MTKDEIVEGASKKMAEYDLDLDFALSVHKRFVRIIKHEWRYLPPGKALQAEEMIEACLEDARGDLDQIAPMKLLDEIACATVTVFCNSVKRRAPEFVRETK